MNRLSASDAMWILRHLNRLAETVSDDEPGPRRGEMLYDIGQARDILLRAIVVDVEVEAPATPKQAVAA
jgi:hypothetical protein